MSDYLNIKSPNWLGGVNVHNTFTIDLLVLLAYKVGEFKK